TALQLLRDAGVAPLDVLNPMVSMDQLLDGSLASGSVQERLGEFYGHLELAAGSQGIESFYNLTRASFQEAREHLAEEILAFSRSQTAQLPPEPANPDGFRRYAGTTSEPSELPGVAWAARAGYFAEEPLVSGQGFDELTASEYGLRQLVGRAVVEARRIISLSDNFPEAARAEGLAPLALLAAAPEFRGHA